MIQAESDVQKRDEYLQKLMVLPNQVICLIKKPHYFLYLFNVIYMHEFSSYSFFGRGGWRLLGRHTKMLIF